MAYVIGKLRGVSRKAYELLRRPLEIRADRDRYSTYPAASREQRRFYNIGAGSFRHPMWTNVDHITEWYKDVQKGPFINYDIMSMALLPLPDGQAEIIYTSHVIEHVSTAAAAHLFSEAYRTLKPGGVFRITCPDAALLYNATMLDQRQYWRWRFPWLKTRGFSVDDADIFDFLIIEICTSRSKYLDAEGEKLSASEARHMAERLPMTEYLDWLVSPCKFDPTRPFHMNWWTHEKCEILLQQAGFTKILKSTYGGSCAAPLQATYFFDNSSPQKSLYIEAIK